jgi:hypothetical protein
VSVKADGGRESVSVQPDGRRAGGRESVSVKADGGREGGRERECQGGRRAGGREGGERECQGRAIPGCNLMRQQQQRHPAVMGVQSGDAPQLVNNGASCTKAGDKQ